MTTSLIELDEAVTAAVEKVMESTVFVESLVAERESGGHLRGSGSGVILSEDGYVITNSHVVRRFEETTVRLRDGSRHAATIVGEDPYTDLALLKIDPGRKLRPAEFASSGEVRIGQMAIAVGHALGLPGDPTVSMGVVSAVDRPLPWADYMLEGVIQSDAAINPGNSGGPMTDSKGRVIGVNVAMIQPAQGLGFAIPSDTVKRIASELMTKGKVSRAWIGIAGESLTPLLAKHLNVKETEGVFITSVKVDSPAYLSGVREGDVLLTIDGKAVKRSKDIVLSLLGRKVNDRVVLGMTNFERSRNVGVVLAEMPQIEAFVE